MAVGLVTSLGGCESLGRGVTQALLEGAGEPAEDTRLCEGEGVPVPGIEPLLAKLDDLPPIVEGDGSRPQVKVVYVHGIGTHEVGHGTELANNLGRSLGLDVRAPRTKRILLTAPAFEDRPLGELNLIRMSDQNKRRDLIFYELTWSVITQPAKDALAFDRSDLYRTRRAGLNQAMRTFVNDVAPDPIAYAGARREQILTSVGQSMCWALSKSWSELPEETTGTNCGPGLPGFGSRVRTDDLVFITHSLGSRATLDGLERIAGLLPDLDARYRPVAAALREHDLQVFMLSNQLPLLEAGEEPQEFTGAAAEFCGPGAPRSQERIVRSLHAIAFSDPNDLMSYPVPVPWAEQYVDSRLCPRITNIDINVARVSSLLGVGDAANPLAAHVGYAADERVGGILARGIGHPGAAPVVQERCTWRESDEALMR
jgi:hypothetical protein